jgi:hypothetical protein
MWKDRHSSDFDGDDRDDSGGLNVIESCTRPNSISYKTHKPDIDYHKYINVQIEHPRKGMLPSPTYSTSSSLFSWFAYINTFDTIETVYLGSWTESQCSIILSQIFNVILSDNTCFLKPMKHIVCKHVRQNNVHTWTIERIMSRQIMYFKFNVDWKYKCQVKQNWTLDPNQAIHSFEKFILHSHLLKNKSRKELLSHCENCYPQIYDSCCKDKFIVAKSPIIKKILQHELDKLDAETTFFNDPIFCK